MTITGDLFIGQERVRRTRTFRSINAATGEALETAFSIADAADVDQACLLAESAFDAYRMLEVGARARFLDAIAEQILQLGDELLERTHEESGLLLARLTGERGRTVGQLRLLAAELRKGNWLTLRHEPALPDRVPPRPELRLMKVPLGPVVVFGASNFPLAFSVAGGDTAAALAAGCPVIVKGHPAHPGASELVAQAIAAAALASGMPPGVFSLLNDNTNELGVGLVKNPRIKAVAFTGSRSGGLALTRIANERPEPIPIYAEMSAINPVLLLPDALATRADQLAVEFVDSLTLGVGQFCTNPGVILAIAGPDLERFLVSAANRLQQVVPGVMLTPGIRIAYEAGVQRMTQHEAVRIVARGAPSSREDRGRGALFTIGATEALLDPAVLAEIFGPASVVIQARNEAQLFEVLEHLEGQLTITFQMTLTDASLVARLRPIAERKAGRLLANGWPTGVEVSAAMVHGGPFPATSDGRTTSVGTLAIERFLRPVCYQNLPEAVLPQPLRNQ